MNSVDLSVGKRGESCATGNGAHQENAAALTVYYDGACPLCRREIGFYRQRNDEGVVNWVDVSSGGTAAITPDLQRADALARFHVRRSDGTLESGARGFAELWAVTPGFRWLGSLARLRLVQPVLEFAYRIFLRVRPAVQHVVSKLER